MLCLLLAGCSHSKSWSCSRGACIIYLTSNQGIPPTYSGLHSWVAMVLRWRCDGFKRCLMVSLDGML
ncbi:hypothetical protein L2E82_35466 [Cichorium intybus]|uniref:Uncharacterized protein n=1 Tax=Cichorium intybus TaxID=13427 RepID=A0ACB9BNV7_CICIN|nr:hypothetical protein L2E82_35466 [Cichorium intybus]